MSTFEVPILAIDDVYDHPNADRLSIVRIRGYEAVAGKLEDGSHRFQKGEPIIYVPEGAVVPEQHLRERGYWNEDKNTGMLAGTKGDRVKAISLRGVLSQGLVWKVVNTLQSGQVVISFGQVGVTPYAAAKTEVGANVAEFFGIEKYVPKVPTSMDGRMVGLFESRFDYDIENIKNYPDLFQAGEPVVVTEKLHGTFSRISHISKLEPRDDLFGDGRVVMSTKGMGKDGLTFINIPENAGNLYVQTFTQGDFIERFQALAESRFPGANVHLMGEVFGPGVQDLHYGLSEKQFRAFDVAITDHEGTLFLDEDHKADFFEALGVDRVPVLYDGPFDRAVIDNLASGNTTFNNATATIRPDGSTFVGVAVSPHIREGVVITAAGVQVKRTTALGGRLRPILKHVSPAYLTRKGGTEYQ